MNFSFLDLLLWYLFRLLYHLFLLFFWILFFISFWIFTFTYEKENTKENVIIRRICIIKWLGSLYSHEKTKGEDVEKGSLNYQMTNRSSKLSSCIYFYQERYFGRVTCLAYRYNMQTWWLPHTAICAMLNT